MPPIYRAENGLLVIRPLIKVREASSIHFVTSQNIPVAPDCNCPAKQPTSDKPPYRTISHQKFLKRNAKLAPSFL